MKVLVLGATGSLGSRLIPALLTHSHDVVAFVRSSSKLEALLPKAVYQRITVVQGDAKSPASVRSAISDTGVDAVVSAAGLAALPPWGKSDLPEIFRAVLEGVREASQARGSPLRTWFLGGTSVLCYPGTETMLSRLYVSSTLLMPYPDMRKLHLLSGWHEAFSARGANEPQHPHLPRASPGLRTSPVPTAGHGRLVHALPERHGRRVLGPERAHQRVAGNAVGRGCRCSAPVASLLGRVDSAARKDDFDSDEHWPLSHDACAECRVHCL